MKDQPNQISALMGEAGIKDYELMAALDVSATTVWRMKQGLGLTAERLIETADFLAERLHRRVSTDEILGRDRQGTAA